MGADSVYSQGQEMEAMFSAVPACQWMTGLAALCLVGSTALAGPEWEEPTGGDAGNTLQTAANISASGGGYVGIIRGKLDGNAGGNGLTGGDYQDMFRINIVDPGFFLVETVALANGLPDPMLFLFNREGYGIAASNDIDNGFFQSKIDANDADMPLYLEAGIYYLAITAALSEPTGHFGGEYGPIFEMGLSEHQVGQWGPSGFFAQSALSGWTDPSYPENYGFYEIMLHGVGSVPAPGALALMSLAGIASRRRRRSC
jgi:MYXO-CTERM domain-containing protein